MFVCMNACVYVWMHDIVCNLRIHVCHICLCVISCDACGVRVCSCMHLFVYACMHVCMYAFMQRVCSVRMHVSMRAYMHAL